MAETYLCRALEDICLGESSYPTERGWSDTIQVNEKFTTIPRLLWRNPK